MGTGRQRFHKRLRQLRFVRHDAAFAQRPGHIVQDAELARRHPYWGYTNAAGAFRADLRRERPFRTDMPGTEDKEWAWHWLQRGKVAVYSPELQVDHDHTKDSLGEIWTRATREWTGFSMYLPVERYPLPDALADVWRQGREHEYRHPMNWLRVATGVAGEWWTRGRAARARAGAARGRSSAAGS